MPQYKIHDDQDLREKEITVIIPAAGLGKRMKSYGPKPLIRIRREKTILQNQLKLFNQVFRNPTIILVCGFQAEKLMDESSSDIIKVENEFYEETNVARSIAMGLRATTGKNVLVSYGDLVFNKEAIECLDYRSSSISVSENQMGEDEVGCIVNKRGHLEHMMYDLPLKWNQLLYLQGAELEKFKKIVYNKKNSKLFGFEIINKLINAGSRIKCTQHPKVRVIDVDTSKDTETAKGII